MSIGDRVKLHIDQGHRDILDLPKGVGTISNVDTSQSKTSVLVRFDDLMVYVSPVSEEEIEVLDGEDPKARTVRE